MSEMTPACAVSGIWIIHRDEHGMASSASIIARACANENPLIVEAHRSGDYSTPYEHGLASDVFDDGATLLCRPCAVAKQQEAARQARLARLAPAHRQWLADRGLSDWPVR